MNYRVDWTAEAERELADLWVSADDQAAVTAAARQLERLLAIDPFMVGESRHDFDIRLGYERPLAALFRVEVPQRTVVVVAIGPAKPR